MTGAAVAPSSFKERRNEASKGGAGRGSCVAAVRPPYLNHCIAGIQVGLLWNTEYTLPVSCSECRAKTPTLRP